MLALRRLCFHRSAAATRSLLSSPIALPSLQTPLTSSWRPFSSDDDKKDNTNKQESDSDFFLRDEDTLPSPPAYVRDSLTGKWTDRTQAELTPKESRLLNLDDDAKSEEIMNRLGDRWKDAAAAVEGEPNDGFGVLNSEHERIASRIQEQRLALGPIGRGPVATSDDESDETPLSRREMQALRSYAQKEHSIHPKEFDRLMEDDPDLLPHGSVSSGAAQDRTNTYDSDIDLAYLNPKLNKMAFSPEGAEYQHTDPFADLLPSDFDPARKVNRRHAKPLPPKALHHNNLVLLRRYSTPGGKIMNRVQSRLGAKDQRKVAKLIKRARHLGLIPHMGQWKFEDHGYLHDKTLEEEEKREWEIELEKRGLWPLAEDKDVFKRYYGLDEMIDHLAGGVDGRKRAELEELLRGNLKEKSMNQDNSGGAES
ncbi:hypothetical protein HJC23_004585 [Cyclotella cryptica]|uniref:Ribosomal protein S18 n=1 Tax=Cyclotella cryptica TaxID=29204 RepID=A0ABD3QFC4_9STRA|eukprot:CCRYP_005895-RA/>CCRYP_005895-RA protein AED:0.01 eAED:0.01 QI:288/-1/1/1/-1/1/1/167/423